MNLFPAQIILIAIIITFLLVFFLGQQFYYISNLVVLQCLFFLFVIQYSQIGKFDTKSSSPLHSVLNYPQLHIILALISFQITQLIFTNNSAGSLFKLPYIALIPFEYLSTIYIVYSVTSGYDFALSMISANDNDATNKPYNIRARAGFFYIYIALMFNLVITLAKIILFEQAAAD